MRIESAVAGMLMGIALGASAAPAVVRDWGLHRQWTMESDPAHPERPARLVEIPWSAEETSSRPTRPAVPVLPVVRTGMRVKVVRREAAAEIRLEGTALGNGRPGEGIAVRAGFGIVHGIVRGPGVVELTREKNR